MKGDFSRYTFDPKKHYSAVLNQQGRVQVDADSNEQQAINQYRIDTETKDVVGLCGVPETIGGFEISVLNAGDVWDLAISPGRIYVDGILCELEEMPFVADITLENIEPDFRVTVSALKVDGYEFQKNQWIEIVGIDDFGKDILKVQALIAAVDLNTLVLSVNNSSLSKEELEKFKEAFDEASDRRVRRITTYTTQPDYPNPGFTAPLDNTNPPRLNLDLLNPEKAYLVYLDVWQHHITVLDDPRIREVALGGPDTNTRLKTVWQVKLLEFVVNESPEAVTCNTTFPEWNQLTAPSTGTLNARTQKPQSDDNPCLLPPEAGYQRLENQLYRVEIHQGGTIGGATFKWSRDNGTVVTSILKINGQTITVQDIGPDDVLGFANGQWVEIVDDQGELSGRPGQLLQITNVDSAGKVLLLANNPDGVNPALHPKLRRWDSTGAIAVEVPASNDGWIQLEGGIEVQFSDGTYKTGDYWLIPARTATGEIEWPPYDVPNTSPIPQLPLGIKHHYCRLAIIEVKEEPKLKILEDCRQLFSPLTKVKVNSGIHIIEIFILDANNKPTIPLKNNAAVRVDMLARGVCIVCDGEINRAFFTNQPTSPNQPNPVCFVTLDLPFPIDDAQKKFWKIDQVIGYQPTILAANAEVNGNGNVISWKPLGGTSSWLTDELSELLKIFPENQGSNRVLAHLTLKGNFIWAANDPQVYLDGEAFGIKDEDKTPHSLRLPSGDGRRGGNFEMWFWLVSNRQNR